MQIRVKLWLEEAEKVLFGEGRLKLLQAVEEAGSLAGAARLLSMSYRAAWGRLKASEERLGFALVEKSGLGRHALQLTPAARTLMERYQALQDKADKALAPLQRAIAQDLQKFRQDKS